MYNPQEKKQDLWNELKKVFLTEDPWIGFKESVNSFEI